MSLGMMLGCLVSPLVFSIILNVTATEIRKNKQEEK